MAGSQNVASFFFKAGIVIIAGFGLLQLLYVVPLILILRKHGRPDFAKGMVIAASLSFALSAACWGTMALSR